MVDISFYLVTEEVARRSGVIDSRYRTEDGRFVLDNKDLSNIRLTSDEYVSGLQGIEKVSRQEASRLIAENNRTLGKEETEEETNEKEEMSDE